MWIDTFESEKIHDYEIVICNDKSTDSTESKVLEMAAHNTKIKLINHEKNQGAAQAVITAGTNATGKYILFTDSDMQFPREGIEKIISANTKNPEQNIFSYRNCKEDGPIQKLGTAVTKSLFNIFSNYPQKDPSCILKLYRKTDFQELNLKSTGLNVSTEMACRSNELGHPFIQVEVPHQKRIAGEATSQGVRAVKHGARRVIFLIYYYLRSKLIKYDLISP
jgi:glycosyltransferase involved in cell wall biosynthesis